MSTVRFMVLIATLFCAVGHAGEAPDLSGAELYRQFCASCHGTTARGDGPVAPALKSRVPDLTLIAKRRGGRFDKERVKQSIAGQRVHLAHGAREMPVWGWELYAFKGEDPARRKRVDELVTSLADYLESIQRK
jgi:mono/diheme cytochrome c family protein